MSMSELQLPSYYIIDRMADVSEMLHFLSVTPVYCVLITSMTDFDLARQYNEEVIMTDQPHVLADQINRETGRCPIILSDKTETYYANSDRQG